MATIDFRRFPSASEVYLCRDRGYFPVLASVRGEEVLAVIRAGAGHVGRYRPPGGDPFAGRRA